MQAAGTKSNNVALGHNAGLLLSTAARNIFLGPFAGYRQTAINDLLIIDNLLRADAATEVTNAIIYGLMASTPAGQTLRINARIVADATTPAMIWRAAGSQTANLTEWRNSSEAVLVSVSATGTVKTSGRQRAVATKTADYTATANDEHIRFTASATLTLPAATGTGQAYSVKAAGDAVTVIIDANGAETIDGKLTIILAPRDGVQIIDAASGVWDII
jgi:hypothetical protein